MPAMTPHGAGLTAAGWRVARDGHYPAARWVRTQLARALPGAGWAALVNSKATVCIVRRCAATLVETEAAQLVNDVQGQPRPRRRRMTFFKRDRRPSVASWVPNGGGRWVWMSTDRCRQGWTIGSWSGWTTMPTAEELTAFALPINRSGKGIRGRAGTASGWAPGIQRVLCSVVAPCTRRRTVSATASASCVDPASAGPRHGVGAPARPQRTRAGHRWPRRCRPALCAASAISVCAGRLPRGPEFHSRWTSPSVGLILDVEAGAGCPALPHGRRWRSGRDCPGGLVKMFYETCAPVASATTRSAAISALDAAPPLRPASTSRRPKRIRPTALRRLSSLHLLFSQAQGALLPLAPACFVLPPPHLQLQAPPKRMSSMKSWRLVQARRRTRPVEGGQHQDRAGGWLRRTRRRMLVALNPSIRAACGCPSSAHPGLVW